MHMYNRPLEHRLGAREARPRERRDVPGITTTTTNNNNNNDDNYYYY